MASDFEQKVAAFQRAQRRKNNARDDSRQRYVEVLKDYQALKYGPVKDGVRQVKEITQERIERQIEAKKPVNIDVNSLLDFVDLDIGVPTTTGIDLNMGEPKPKGKRK